MSPFYTARTTFYCRSTVTMVLSRTVSEINGDFRRKSQNFPPPCILAPAEGVLLGIGCWRSGTKKLEYGDTGPRKKFDDIFSRLDTIYQRDRRTDRRTPADSKDRAYA